MLQDGRDFFDRSDSAAVDDTALSLNSGAGSISWGIWQFNSGEDAMVSLDITFNLIDGEAFYLGVADFDQNRWELAGPYNASLTLDLDNARHRSPEGNAYVCLIAADGTQASVEQLELHTDRTGWQIITLDTGLEHGYGFSIAEIAGKPGISYVGYRTSQMVAYELLYAYCNTPTGAQPEDWGIVRADPDPITTYGTSLAEVEGTPAIAYTYKPETSQWYVAYTRSSTALADEAGDWSSRILVDESSDQAWHPTLVVAGGSPGIFYNDFGQSDLEYSWSTNTRGTDPLAWEEHVTVDADGMVGRIPAATVLYANKPAVTYYDSDNQALKYSHSESENGVGADSWLGNASIIETLDTVSQDPYFSFALIADKPAYCVYDEAGGNLHYRRARNFNGGPEAFWDDIVVIDTDGEWGKFCSLADVRNHPAISFYDSSGSLMYVRSSSSDGQFESAWSDVQSIDAGNYDATAIAEVDGKPAIVYYDEGNQILKYAILFE
jgi:hypothetical protein